MFTVVLYLIVFLITVLLSSILANYAFCGVKNNYSIKLFNNKFSKERGIFVNCYYRSFICFFIAFIPLIFIFTVRYGIGEDYFSYEAIYNDLHESSIKEYFELHALSAGHYYVEPFYYLLNRISPSYVFLQFLIAFLLSVNLSAVENEYPEYGSYIIYIFLCCNFIYSINATRFVLGLSYILLALTKLLKRKYIQFIVLVAISALLHKTFILTLGFLLLIGSKNTKKNKLLNYITIALVLSSPLIIPLVLKVASHITLFSRYFTASTYEISDSAKVSTLWLMHIIPVAVTLLFVPKEDYSSDQTFSTIFRIYLLEIPFRFASFYNTWIGRLARIPQLTQVFLVPYVLSKQDNKKNKWILFAFYIIWYTFYFIYNFWTDGAKDFQWIFNRSI